MEYLAQNISTITVAAGLSTPPEFTKMQKKKMNTVMKKIGKAEKKLAALESRTGIRKSSEGDEIKQDKDKS